MRCFPTEKLRICAIQLSLEGRADVSRLMQGCLERLERLENMFFTSPKINMDIIRPTICARQDVIREKLPRNFIRIDYSIARNCLEETMRICHYHVINNIILFVFVILDFIHFMHQSWNLIFDGGEEVNV
jgi:hypothetical protein